MHNDRRISDLRLSLASLVMDEVYHDGDGCQDAEADSQRYSGVHPDVNTLVCINTYTVHSSRICKQRHIMSDVITAEVSIDCRKLY